MYTIDIPDELWGPCLYLKGDPNHNFYDVHTCMMEKCPELWEAWDDRLFEEEDKFFKSISEESA
jgi:hypothetical protein